MEARNESSKSNRNDFHYYGSLFGCATGSSIITGQVRPAIDPTEVKIYLNPPSQYETIGRVEASAYVSVWPFSQQAAQNRIIEKLKKQAAKVGANGVVLLDTENSEITKNARGEAVYVIE